MYFNHADGHSLIQWEQLTQWSKCEKWTDFSVNSLSYLDLSKNPCNYFIDGKKKPVTLALTVLVVIEMFNAMNAISDEQSLLKITPFENFYLIAAIFFSMATHCMILYVPFFNEIFGILPLDASEWILVLAFSFPVVLIDEIIKFACRTILETENKMAIKDKTD